MNGDVKETMRAFYASEAGERDTVAWLGSGGSARIPESPAARYFVERKVAVAVAMAGAPAAARVLEVGCSFGHMSFLLAERFADVTAVDLSPESIDLARRRAARWNVRHVRFETGDAERLDGFADASFDAVFSFSTLRFCPDPAAALAAFRRVLRPGGRLAVDFPNRRCPWYGTIKRGLAIEPHVHDRLFLAEDAERLVRDAGFERVRSRTVLFTSKRVPDAALPVFRVADLVLERVPGVRRYAGIVMVRGERRASD